MWSPEETSRREAELGVMLRGTGRGTLMHLRVCVQRGLEEHPECLLPLPGLLFFNKARNPDLNLSVGEPGGEMGL